MMKKLLSGQVLSLLQELIAHNFWQQIMPLTDIGGGSFMSSCLMYIFLPRSFTEVLSWSIQVVIEAVNQFIP